MARRTPWPPLLFCRWVFYWVGWRLAGYGYGWPMRLPDGKWYFHIERVVICKKYRGQSRRIMLAMLDDMWRKVDRLGLAGAITRIKESRPGVLHVGQRWAGYVPFTTEGGFVWCSVTRRKS